jgi:hypothetical protein
MTTQVLYGQDSANEPTRKCLYQNTGPAFLQQELKLNDQQLIEKSTGLAIPVVFHIVQSSNTPYITDQQIIDQIRRINEDFSGTNTDKVNVPTEFSNVISDQPIKFCLSSLDPTGSTTDGIIRTWSNVKGIGLDSLLFYSELGGSDAWSTNRYLNIWVADFGENESLTGFASSPNGGNTDERQGVVVNPLMFAGSDNLPFSMGRTAVHEIGHFLGLEHLWGNGSCESDDFVVDTPSQNAENYGCPTFPQISCESEDMFMNFMDYVDDECMIFFTVGQKERMLAILEMFRPELLQPCNICHEDPIDGDNEELSFLIYPNPVSTDKIKIQMLPNSQNRPLIKLIEIYTPLGVRLYTRQHLIYTDIEIDFDINLTSGTYFIAIGDNVSKLVVIK